MSILSSYQNGNYITTLLNDGTKIRRTEEDEFIPAFAESMDIKLLDYCDAGCQFCHEGSSIHGDFGNILNEPFINTLHPFQEVALGGGDVTSHPDLIPFLQRLKERNIIANITVNQKHFEEKQQLIQHLVKNELIYGLGVSLVNPTDDFIQKVQQYPNAVIHIINGIVTQNDMIRLSNHNLKVLILGYKDLRRGSNWLSSHSDVIRQNQEWLYQNIEPLLTQFRVVSFDNLAIEQLNVKRLLFPEEWEHFYMGDDSEFTYYIDMVKRQFSKSSTSPFEERYPLMDNVDDMFQKIRKQKTKEEQR